MWPIRSTRATRKQERQRPRLRPRSQRQAVAEVRPRRGAVKEAEPDVTKDPEPEAKAKPVKKAKKKPKKLPPWLNKPKDDDGDDDDDDSSCKGAHPGPRRGDSPATRCEKCKTTPAEAAGLSGTHDMNAAPVPELLESPPMASTKGGPTPHPRPAPTRRVDEPGPAHREPTGPSTTRWKPTWASDGDHETPPASRPA